MHHALEIQYHLKTLIQCLSNRDKSTFPGGYVQLMCSWAVIVVISVIIVTAVK